MKKKAFTLIELLVVIAIIALLMAVIMPSLMEAKEQARGVYCRNNLKQMAMAASAYTVNNDGYYPIAHYTMTVTISSSSEPGVNVIPGDEPHDEVIYGYAWDFSTINHDGRIETTPGILWQSETIEQVQQCPSYKGSNNWAGDPYTGYNYNTSFIGHGQGERVSPDYTGQVVQSPDGLSSIVLPVKAGQVRSTASCALFGDGHYVGGANKFMRSPFYWDGDYDAGIRLGGTQGYRHSGRTNVAWCDGHATSQADYFTDSSKQVRMQLDGYNLKNKIKVGFLSSNNSLYDLD